MSNSNVGDSVARVNINAIDRVRMTSYIPTFDTAELVTAVSGKSILVTGWEMDSLDIPYTKSPGGGGIKWTIAQVYQSIRYRLYANWANGKYRHG